jgi:hypothetical protein
MPVLPAVNALVAVREDDREYRSRVEDVYADTVVLARPMDLPLGHRFSVGAELMITWTGERGVFVLPGRLAEQQSEGLVNLWTVQVTGQGWVEQRRAYVRAKVAGPVQLEFPAVGQQLTEAEVTPEGGEARLMRGQLVDLSEAALRCVVPFDSVLGGSDVGAVITARLVLDATEFALPSTLQRAQPNVLRPELREVVLLFDQPVWRADELRRIVYTLQLKDRVTR